MVLNYSGLSLFISNISPPSRIMVNLLDLFALHYYFKVLAFFLSNFTVLSSQYSPNDHPKLRHFVSLQFLQKNNVRYPCVRIQTGTWKVFTLIRPCVRQFIVDLLSLPRPSYVWVIKIDITCWKPIIFYSKIYIRHILKFGYIIIVNPNFIQLPSIITSNATKIVIKNYFNVNAGYLKWRQDYHVSGPLNWIRRSEREVQPSTKRFFLPSVNSPVWESLHICRKKFNF